MLTDLTRRYCEPNRMYHVLTHPAEMIEVGMRRLELSNLQILAIWYHDAIYVAGSTTNEQESANLFIKDYQNILDRHERDVVAEIIMDTKTHIPSFDESKKVIDLDLMGLGSVHAEYWENARKVRFEYSAFTDAEWKIGRTKFLEKMVGREQIFYTDFGIKYEKRARENMLYELNLLKVGNPHYK